ncbi:hypothetical protein HY214_02200, partial [Candidatus Roizmanbacteria bacterium]|nr:hypothetical protein [Candidatus Roizmanbacteria bacterium]
MRHVFDYIRKSKPLLFLIIGGFIYHMLIILPSGSYLCYQTTCGIFFWGAHQHDAIWHLAIANLAFLHTPFIVPFFSGAFLSGYNYLMDLIVFLISRLGLSAGLVYFKILPLLWFFLLVSIGLVFCRKVTRQISFAWFFIFLVLFGGSFGYFLTLYHGQTLKNAAGMLSMQAGLTLANLQFAFSLVAVICLFIIFLKKQLDKRVSLMVGLLLFIIIGLKFYAGVISIFLVFVYYG